MGGTWQPSLSPPLHLLFLLLQLLLLARMTHQAQHQQEDLSCLNDYLGNVSCVWNCLNKSEKVKDQCILWAKTTKRGKESVSCELMSLGQDHCYKGCHLQFNNKDYSVTHIAALEVKCKGKVEKSSNYTFSKNIKLRPPDIPSVARGNLSWSPGPKKPRTMEKFIFERQFKKADEPWEAARVRNHTETTEQLGPLLHLGVRYQARVRVMPFITAERSSYRGTWSDWGPVLTWTSDVGDPLPTPPLQRLPLPVKKISLLCGGLCLVVAMTLCCNKKVRTLSCCNRFKMKSQHIPDPSRYFQPLHTVHGGDFQKWLSPMFGPESFAATQPPDSISPVEVTPMLYTEPYLAPGAFMPLGGKSGEDYIGSGQSSCYSNMGYFYSESQPGLLHIESCPIYFTYPPEAGGNMPKADTSGTSGTSYERLEQIQQFHFSEAPDLHNPQGEQLSPDSGFGVEVSEEGGMNEEEEEEWKRQKEEHSFTARLQSLGIPIPIQAPLSSPLRPPELMSTIMECEDTAPVTSCNYTPSPPEASLARSASMVIQPCGSGYLTVKEMQNTYSNKSI
ncbi:interleukin-2 receptor subunit beta [Alosa sapidissima]|uniref:interleukin-2 receptor subunit beta n=1 Tax=Alosa sapidissima TaxID=34773 RepID=UPI001C09158B|nr:interleukin-2 receptor subunit beta [Alosa sapidissima]XP_041943450.1 interleukin-2 receptor subunit beta [Alosa sapidissima]XP_041943451.1 interleukin-2 receptor subunit beta [Alosa sapidissima]